jgi:hypothetical protein
MILPDLTKHASTDPTGLLSLRDGIYAADLFIAALAGLDFFTWLAEHPADQDQICRGLGLVKRPVDVMLSLFMAMGLVEQEGGRYSLTPLAREHLVQDAPWNLGPYCASLKERPGCKELLQVLRTGRPANWSSQETGKDWAPALEDEAFAASFTAAMDSRGAALGPAMAEKLPCAGYQNLLDIAGGSGIYACCVAARYPAIQAAILEIPPVDRVARRAVANRNLSERVAVIAANMFNDPFPAGFDIHLFSHVLHDWDEPEVKQLLAKSFAALPPGGMVAIHDTHLNTAKTGPLPIAQYSVLLMHSTQGKCYSFGEMEQYLRQAGFSEISSTPTAAYRTLITAKKSPHEAD